MPDESVSSVIGDKLLEVNGTPVAGKSMENIDELIQNSTSILQLTVEHDPHRLSKSMSDAKVITNQPLHSNPTAPKCRKMCCDRSPSVREMSTNGFERHYTKQHSQNDDVDVQCSTLPCKTNAIHNNTSHVNCAIGSNTLRIQKERCSSMSKLLDENHVTTQDFYDLSRTKSFRVDAQEFTPRIFRASDLVIGKINKKLFLLLLPSRGFFANSFEKHDNFHLNPLHLHDSRRTTWQRLLRSSVQSDA